MAYTDKGATMYNNEEGMSRAALLHRPRVGRSAQGLQRNINGDILNFRHYDLDK